MAGKDREYVEPRVDEAERLETARLQAYVSRYLETHPQGQNRLARTVGVSESWLSRLKERGEGNLSLAKLRLILKAMGIPLGNYLESVGVGLVEMIGAEYFADLQAGQAARLSKDPTISAGLRKVAKDFLQRPAAATTLPASPILRQLVIEAGRLSADQQRTVIRLARALAARSGTVCLLCGDAERAGNSDGVCFRCRMGSSPSMELTDIAPHRTKPARTRVLRGARA